MRLPLHATAAVLALALCAPAFAQTATTGPVSPSATNIDPADTHSPISPRLPAPPVAPGANANQYLIAARGALQRGRTGEAQNALEMAETRLLDRSIVAGTNPVDNGPRIRRITDALNALGHGDRNQALQIVNGMLANMPAAQTSM
jgi:hypothetical protein